MAERHIKRGRLYVPESWEQTESRGAGPFEDSRSSYRLPDGSEYAWESRRHRKGRGPRKSTGKAEIEGAAERAAEAAQRGRWIVWAPHRLSWWVAIIFTVGSALFTLGAVASLFPALFGGEEAGVITAEVSYWSGALLFTVSIYMQVLEGLNSSDYIGTGPGRRSRSRGFRLFGWQPRRLEFVAPFLLLIGSLLFNVETTLALAESLGWAALPLLVGITSLTGSVLFLLPSYLQMVEVCHRYLCYRPREISWWVTVFFILGSVGFVVGSVSGFQLPGLSSPEEAMITNVGFLQGSVFFLAGSYLMLPELASE